MTVRPLDGAHAFRLQLSHSTAATTASDRRQSPPTR
jgi:hypothetical protein